MVVVDGSGSMAGLLEGRPPKQARPGARGPAPGARRRSARRPGSGSRPSATGAADCADVEIVRAPEPVDVERMMAPLGADPARGTRAADPRPARGRQAAAPGFRAAQPAVDPRRCRQLPAGRVRGRRRAGRRRHHRARCQHRRQRRRHRQDGLPAAGDGRAAFQGAERRAASPASSARPCAWPAAQLRLVALRHFGRRPSCLPPRSRPRTRPRCTCRALLAPNAEPWACRCTGWSPPRSQTEAVLFDAWAANPVVPVAPGRYVVTVRNESGVGKPDCDRARQPAHGRARGARRRRRARAGDGAKDRCAARRRDHHHQRCGRAPTGAPALPCSRPARRRPCCRPGASSSARELGLVRAEQAVAVTAGRPTGGRHPSQHRTPSADDRRRATASRRSRPPIFIVMEDDPPRGQARGGAVRGQAGGVRASSGDLLHRCAPGQRRGARAAGDRLRRRRQAHPDRGGRPAQPFHQQHGPRPLAGDLVSYTIRRIDDPSRRLSPPAVRRRFCFCPPGAIASRADTA